MKVEAQRYRTIRVPCAVCGADSDSTLLHFRGFRIATCLSCGFVFVNPRPDESELVKLYAGESGQNPYHSADHEPFEAEFPVIRRLLNDLQTYVPSGQLLEVGCGRGDFLRVAAMNGFSAVGCDIYANTAPSFDDPLPIAIRNGTLRGLRFALESFDVVVIRNVLEHVFDPNDEINEIRKVLRPRGYLYLKVPNVDFESGLRSRFLYGKRIHFDPPFHLNHFNARTLRAFLDNARFEFVSWHVEQPTLCPEWLVNLLRQSGYRLIQLVRLLSCSRVFPKPLLSCIVRKAN